MKNQRRTTLLFFLFFFCLVYLTSCGTARSVIPGLKKENSGGTAAGEKLHVKVPPEEAITILDEVAAQNGWQIATVGDQYDMQGLRGKYFRMETTRFLGGRKEVSGVFFSEPGGSYVVVGKSDTGLPEDLVTPFLAAVEARSKGAEGQ